MSGPAWGTPWHGIFSAGVLTLPNGATRAYPEVTANSGAPTLVSGRTYRVKRPEWVFPGRSAEDLAADTLAGKEWRGEAMLSGDNLSLYGERLDGWIYFAPDGSRWLIDNPVNFTIGTLIGPRLRLRPFGRRGPAPDWVVRELKIDARQTPALFVGNAAFQCGIRSSTGFSGEINPGVFLWDVSSSGKRAVWRVSMPRPTFWPGESAPQLIVGWLEVTVSGGDATTPPATTLSVLYNREQTIGVAVAEEVTGLKVAALGFSTSITETPDTSPPPAIVAKYPPGEGYSYVVRTVTTTPIIGPAAGMPNKALGSSTFGGSLRSKLLGRVFAVWYDDAEEPQVATLDMEWGADVEDRHEATVTGGAFAKLVRNPGGGDGVTYQSVNTTTINAEMATLAVGYLECQLKYGASIIATRTECRKTEIQPVTFSASGWSYSPVSTSTQLVGEEYDFSGASSSGATSQVILPTLRPLPVAMPSSGSFDVRFYAPWADWAGWQINDAGAVSTWGMANQAPPAGADVVGAFALRLIPITPHIAGWITYGGPRSVGGVAWQVEHHPVITPSGVDSCTYSTTYGSFGASGWHLHASRDPMTGECARFYPRRVCYV